MKACSPSRIYPRKMAAHGAKYLLIAQGELQPLLPLQGGEDYECTHRHTHTGEGALCGRRQGHTCMCSVSSQEVL